MNAGAVTVGKLDSGAIVQLWLVALYPGSVVGILNSIRLVPPAGGGAALLSRIASRSDPAPLSAVFITMNGSGGLSAPAVRTPAAAGFAEAVARPWYPPPDGR